MRYSGLMLWDKVVHAHAHYIINEASKEGERKRGLAKPESTHLLFITILLSLLIVKGRTIWMYRLCKRASPDLPLLFNHCLTCFNMRSRGKQVREGTLGHTSSSARMVSQVWRTSCPCSSLRSNNCCFVSLRAARKAWCDELSCPSCSCAPVDCAAACFCRAST